MSLTLEAHSLLTAGTMLSPLVFLQSLLSYRLSRTHTHTLHTHTTSLPRPSRSIAYTQCIRHVMYLQAHTAPRAASCMSQTETSKLLGRQAGSAGACGDTHTSVVRVRVQVQSEQDLGALSISILVALVRCVESGWV